MTLSGLDINGPVWSDPHAGLKVVDTRIRCTGEANWCVTLWDHASIVDSEVGGGVDGTTIGHAVAVWAGGTNSANLIQRVNIHHQISAVRLDGGTTVVDSFFHDVDMGEPVYNPTTGQTRTDDHSSDIMSQAGGNTIVRHNRFEGGNTANLFVQWDGQAEQIGSYLVDDNLFVNIVKNGQWSSWGVAIENKGIVGPITVSNNVFTRGWFVSPILVPPGSSSYGNHYVDGAPIN